jgi:hypothetical protein
MDTMERIPEECSYPLVVCPMDYDDVYLCYFLDFHCLTSATANIIPKECRLETPTAQGDKASYTDDAAWEVSSIEKGKDIGEKVLAAFLKECREQKHPCPKPSEKEKIDKELSRFPGAEVYFISVTL